MSCPQVRRQHIVLEATLVQHTQAWVWQQRGRVREEAHAHMQTNEVTEVQTASLGSTRSPIAITALQACTPANLSPPPTHDWPGI